MEPVFRDFHFDASQPGWQQDIVLRDLKRRREFTQQNPKEIEEIKPLAKRCLQYRGPMAEESVLNAYNRAYKLALEELEDPSGSGLLAPSNRRKVYAEELGHACAEIKFHQHILGFTPVSGVSNFQLPARPLGPINM